MKLEQFRVLADDEIEVIHQAALTILSEIGAVVNLPEAVELLAGAGADIDGNRVRISSEVVSEALAKKPKDVVLYDQQGEGIRLGGDRHFHFSGAYNLNVLDYGVDEARPARLEDVVQFTRLADALPEIDGVIPHVLALDQPESSQEQATYRATLENTKKHCLAAPLSFEGAQAWVELGLSVSADPSRPAVSMVVADAPLLQWDSESLRAGILAAQNAIPLFIMAGAMGGMAGPITLAGALPIKIAQCLMAVVLVQAIRPGAPVAYAGAGHSFIDMRSSEIVMASSEHFLGTIAGAQMAAFYGLPSYTCSLLSNSKVPDQQTGIEKFGCLFSAVGGRVSVSNNAGLLANGTIGSLEQMVIDHEMLLMARRLAKGITVNEETLALDVVRQVGPGGTFLATDHTLKHLRSGENLYLTVLDRSPIKAEHQPLWDRAHAEVERLLADSKTN